MDDARSTAAFARVSRKIYAIAPLMSFYPTRFLIFSVIGLPIGFVLTALAFAVSEQPIVADLIFPWALGIALIVGIFGALWKRAS